MNTTTRISIAVALMTLATMPLLAENTISWDGGPTGTGSNWNEVVNWVGDVKPGPHDWADFRYPVGPAEQRYTLGVPQSIGYVIFPTYGNEPTITIGNAVDVDQGNTLTINSGVYRGENVGNNQYFSAKLIIPGDSQWDIRPGYNGGIIVNAGMSGTTGTFAKWGSGALSFRGTNTLEYSGTMTVNQGTVHIDMNTASTFRTNLWNPSTPIVMNGGQMNFITLSPNVYTSEGRVQRLEALTLGAGTSRFSIAAHWRGTRFLTYLAGLTRNSGTALVLIQPSGNAAISEANGYASSIGNDPTGIMGAYLTVATQGTSEPTDWAWNSGVNLVAYTGYTLPSGDPATIANQPSANYLVNNASLGNVNIADPVTDINTLKYSDAAARTLNIGAGNALRLGPVGGILTPSGSGTLTISNGTLTAGGSADNPGEIIFHNVTAINSSATISDNGTGAVALTKSGGGTLTLTTRPTHSGGTFVNAGTLLLPSATPNPLATSSKIQIVGGTLNLGGNTQTNIGSFIMRGGTLLNGTVVRTSGDYELMGGTVSAKLSGTANLVKTGSGALTLTVANNYVGDTYVREGSLRCETGGTTRGDVYVGSPEGGARADFYAVAGNGSSVQAGRNVYVYGNGSFAYGNYNSINNLVITNNGTASTSGGYAYLEGQIYMHGGRFSGTIYKGNTSLVRTFPSEYTAYFAAHKNFATWLDHNFDVAEGPAHLDLISSGNWNEGSVNRNINKTGEGTMQITATGTAIAAGMFNILGGTVLADNASGSVVGKTPIRVAAGSTLGGTGFIGGVAGYTAANVTAAGAEGNTATVAPGTIDPLTGDHIVGSLTVGSATQANDVTFGDNSKLKITFDAASNCDKLVVNGVLSLDSLSDTIEIDAVDPDKLVPGTYTIATFTSLATPGTKFNTITKSIRGQVIYTPTSIEYVVPVRETVIVIR